MSDILSNYYKTYYTIDNITSNKNHISPLKNKNEDILKNLSQHGIYLSENNILLIKRKNKILPLLLSLNKNTKTNNYMSTIEEPKSIKYSLTSNFYNDKNIFGLNPKLKKCFSYKNKNILNNINKLENESKNIKNLKSRNNNSQYSTIKKNYNNYIINTSNNFRTINSIISPNRNSYKSEKEKEKEKNYKNQNEADQITNELLSLKTKKDIKNYYLKKDYYKFISNTINNEKDKKIDPMAYIKYNFSNEPHNNNKFKSFDLQLMICGNQRYRKNLLDGVNYYKNNFTKYEDLKGPIGLDINQIKEKKNNDLIEKMKYFDNKDSFYDKKLPEKNNFKTINSFIYDDNFKNLKKLLYKNIEKYEKQINFNNINKININLDKKDIKTLNRIDSNAELVINDKKEIVKFSNKFLSFDYKMNKLLNKTRNTTDYLFKRANIHQKIKSRIDKLYNNIEEYNLGFKNII